MKPIIITAAWLSHLAAHQLSVPVRHVPTHPAGSPLVTIKLIKPLPQANPAAAEPLAPAALPFAPVGTHANDYPVGECTYGVASMKGNIPDWGNANNWANAARAAGITVSSVPIVGAVAQTDRGAYGHVATVVAVYPDNSVDITEMNYDYNGSVRTRHADPGEFVYIYV